LNKAFRTKKKKKNQEKQNKTKQKNKTKKKKKKKTPQDNSRQMLAIIMSSWLGICRCCPFERE
jgi:hypothetical protein